MTNYHPDVQRAYESHCADGYVVPDDETGPQEATGATESDETRVQAHGDGTGLREAVEALASRWLRLSGTAIDKDVREWTKAAGMTLLATLALHPAPTGDARGALDETLDDLTRTLARAEKAEDALRRVVKVCAGWEAGKRPIHWRGYVADIDRALTNQEATR